METRWWTLDKGKMVPLFVLRTKNAISKVRIGSGTGSGSFATGAAKNEKVFGEKFFVPVFQSTKPPKKLQTLQKKKA